jgi:NodT family efflux transporter outer membrane factor (OMF) lipoprotein
MMAMPAIGSRHGLQFQSERIVKNLSIQGMTRAPMHRGKTARPAAARAGWPALLTTLLLGGCAVGPDFVQPAAPSASGYSVSALPSSTASAPGPAGAAQRLNYAHDLQADWWRLFKSPALDTLVEHALSAHPSLAAAQAALRIAQANVAAQQGYFLPTLQASYAPSRTKIAGNQGGNSPGVQGDGSVISTQANPSASQGGTAPFNAPVTYNFHTAQLSVGFVPDVFGGNARQVEALGASADYQYFLLQAASVTLASNVVAAAIQEALLRQQIVVVTEIISAGEQSLLILDRQWQAGLVSRLDLALQQSALAQTRQLLPPLNKQRQQTLDLLRALLGLAQDVALPAAVDLATLTLPEDLPLSLPSQLVEQRPDVRAAQALLQAASAEVGVAVANRLPQFAINANAGGAAARFGQMFWASGQFFSFGASIAQTLFDGGTLKNRQRAAEAALQQAGAQYQLTAITAFQNVADVLQALLADAQALQASDDAERAARTSLDLLKRQWTLGYIDRLALLGAEQTYRQSVLTLLQAQATRLGDSAALFQALGGGWWHLPDKLASLAGPALQVGAH